jgi:DNA-binding transcriptional ArsR family regulator
MTILFRREVPMRKLLAVTGEQARALAAPVRLAMLELLGNRPMSIDELAAELPAHGFRQAPNTLRHHLELLRKAGLVEQAVLEQTRGAVLQYYSATGRPLHNNLPGLGEEDLEALTARLRTPVSQALGELRASEHRRLARVAGKVADCPRCAKGQVEELVLLTALHQAAVDALRENEAAMPARVRSRGPASPERR